MNQEIQTPAFQNIHRDFGTFIRARGYKGKMYQSNVKEFLIWLECQGIILIKEATTSDMMKYYQYLMERRNKRRGGTLSDSSIKLHLLAISMFVEHLLDNDELVKGFQIPKHGRQDQQDRNYLTVDEVKILYQSAENPLERAILSVAYGCGLRRSELERINTSDIQLSSGMLVVRNGKGDKRREVPMSDTVLADIKKYITEYRYQLITGRYAEPALFINQRGKRMSGETLCKTLKKIIERSGNQSILDKEITLHCLRHSIAHHLMENNADIDFIRGFLGHSFINTSYIYALKNKKRTAAKIRQHQLNTEPAYV